MSSSKPPTRDTAYNRSKDVRRNLLASSTSQTSSLPHTLSVTDIISARVRELQQFNTSTTTVTGTRRLYQCLVRHKRRRAMSHNTKLIPKTLREAAFREMLKHLESGGRPPTKKLHRNIRRSKRMVLLNKFARAQHNKWLETHHFLSKRTKMANIWGYRVPLHTNDKADRAVEKLQAVKCTFSDESFNSPIEITANPTMLSWMFATLNHLCNVYVDQIQPHLSTLSTTPHDYALERLKKEVFAATSPEITNGSVELSQLFRYPSYSTLLFSSTQQFPGLQTSVIEDAMKRALSWVNCDNLTASSLANVILSPVRVQFLSQPPTTNPTKANLLQSCWVWVHPSSLQLVHAACDNLLHFFSLLHSTAHNQTITQPYVATILSNQLSRYSLRGPKSALVLDRILDLVDSSTPSAPSTTTSQQPSLNQSQPPDHIIWSQIAKLQTIPTFVRSNTVLTLHVKNPQTAPKRARSTQTGSAFPVATASARLLTKSNKFAIEPGLCAADALSFAVLGGQPVQKVKPNQLSKGQSAQSQQQSTLSTFHPAGDGTSALKPTTFIPSTWTHSSSTSYPARYTAPLDQAPVQPTPAHQPFTSPTEPFLSIFSSMDRAQLINQSPGNTSVLNIIHRRNIEMPTTSLNSAATPTQKQTPAPALSSTTILLVIHNNTTPSNSTATTSTIAAQTTSNLQTGFDLIVPRGWGRAFALKCLKEAGAILVGKNQRNVLNLESGSIQDAFPHPSTYPNSFAVQSVLRLKRITKTIALFRKKRLNGPPLTRFGLLGPNYPALVQASAGLPHKADFTSQMGDDSPSTPPNVLQLTPAQQLTLIFQIRRWLSKLVRFSRSKQRQQRKQRHLSISTPSTKSPSTTSPTRRNRFPCPIPNLASINPLLFPTSDFQSYKHASTKRTLNSLFKLTTLSPTEKQNAIILLSSPFSPLFIPPITWLHKRTYQSQALLKPLLPLTVSQKARNTATPRQSSLQPFLVDNPPQIQAQSPPTTDLLDSYHILNLAEYNTDATTNATSSPHQCTTPFDPSQFNIINQPLFQFPILLNTIIPTSTALPGLFSLKSTFSQFLTSTFPTLAHSTQSHNTKLALFSTIVLYVVLDAHTTMPHQPHNIFLPLRLDQLSKGQLVKMQKNDKSGTSGQTGVLACPAQSDLLIIYNNLRNQKQLETAQNQQQATGELQLSEPNQNNLPIGFTTFSHMSLQSGHPYALAFIAASGLCRILKEVLNVHQLVPDLAQSNALLALLRQSPDPIPFAIHQVLFPVVVQTEQHQKLAWGKVISL